MAEDNQQLDPLQEPAGPESGAPPPGPETESSAAWNLVPVSAEEFTRARRRRKAILATCAIAVLALSGWIYKRNVDPIHALEAFDAGERLMRTARYNQAIVSFDRAIALKPDYAEAYTMRARTNIALSKPLVALPDFDKVIELRPRDPQAYLDRGSAHVTLQEWPEALADITRALELDPKLATGYNMRGSAIRAMGDLKKALPDFERAVEILPSMDNIFQRGATYQRLGMHEKAIADFSRLISAEPGSAQAYFARAQSFRAMGDNASAQRDHRIGRILDGK